MHRTRIRLHSSHVAYGLITLCIALIIFLSQYVEQPSPKDYVLAFIPVLTTFLGATLAFRLNESAAETKEEERRFLALNEALFVLVRQHNAIEQIKRDFDRFDDDHKRAFVLPAFKPPSYADLRIKVEDLGFLLLEERPQLLLEITVEQERFEQILEGLTLRNRHYVEQVQPAMAAAGLMDKAVSLRELEGKLAVPIYKGALQAATNVYEHLQASSKNLFNAHAELIALGRKLFPGRKFVSYE